MSQNTMTSQKVRKKYSKHKIGSEEEKTHTFFWGFWEEMKQKMDLVESDTECLGRFQSKEKVNSHKKFKGKLKKILKTALTVQNTCFSRLR